MIAVATIMEKTLHRGDKAAYAEDREDNQADHYLSTRYEGRGHSFPFDALTKLYIQRNKY